MGHSGNGRGAGCLLAVDELNRSGVSGLLEHADVPGLEPAVFKVFLRLLFVEVVALRDDQGISDYERGSTRWTCTYQE